LQFVWDLRFLVVSCFRQFCFLKKVFRIAMWFLMLLCISCFSVVLTVFLKCCFILQCALFEVCLKVCRLQFVGLAASPGDCLKNITNNP
jgi:hypothetical protein